MLTERQAEMVALTWYGLTDRQIAERLSVSVKTVKATHQEARHRLGLIGRGSPRVRAAVWLWYAAARQAGRRR